jgi:hypothetical protein
LTPLVRGWPAVDGLLLAGSCWFPGWISGLPAGSLPGWSVEILLSTETPLQPQLSDATSRLFLVKVKVKVKVKVTLRLTVSQLVCLGVEPNLGLLTRVFFFQNYCLVFLGEPSLTRGRDCHGSVFVIEVYHSLVYLQQYLHSIKNWHVLHT